MCVKKTVAIVLSLAMFFCPPLLNVKAAGLSEEEQLMRDRVKALVDYAYEDNSSEYYDGEWNLTGISVGVVKDGKTFFTNRGYHESDLDEVESRTPVTEDSVFEIGSISKVFTGIMFSYLCGTVNPLTSEPYVNPDDTVDKYFDTVHYASGSGELIYPTLLEFATHTSGYPRNPSNNHAHVYSLEDLEWALANLTYENKPGTTAVYSNFGGAVLGQVLAKAYYGEAYPEKGYPEMLDELLCKPLGLDSTAAFPLPNSEIGKRKTLPHYYDGSPSFMYTHEAIAFAPGGGINSTARDMARFTEFLMGKYVPEGMEKMYAAVEKIYEPLVASNSYGLIYTGIAIEIQPYRPHTYLPPLADTPYSKLFPSFPNAGHNYGKMYYHGGLTNGYTAEMYMCLETGTACVVLINNMDSEGSKACAVAADTLGYVLNSDVIVADKVILAPGSVGQPGHRSVTGLTPGKYYTITVEDYKEANGGITLYVASDGTVSDDPASIGPLAGNETHGGILDGGTYKVIDNGFSAPAV